MITSIADVFREINESYGRQSKWRHDNIEQPMNELRQLRPPADGLEEDAKNNYRIAKKLNAISEKYAIKGMGRLNDRIEGIQPPSTGEVIVDKLTLYLLGANQMRKRIIMRQKERLDRTLSQIAEDRMLEFEHHAEIETAIMEETNAIFKETGKPALPDNPRVKLLEYYQKKENLFRMITNAQIDTREKWTYTLKQELRW